MNNLIQAARRSSKAAVKYNVQLAIHRLHASLEDLGFASDVDPELHVVVSRHKKKVMTKAAAIKNTETVWGEIVPLSCTLFMNKVGTIEPKQFEINIQDFKTEKIVARFVLDIAEYVQKDSKCSVTLSATHVSNVTLSLTVVSSICSPTAERFKSRYIAGRSFEWENESNGDDNRSEISAASSRCTTHFQNVYDIDSLGGSKSDVIRSASCSDVGPSISLEALAAHQKNAELQKTISKLQHQLDESNEKICVLSNDIENLQASNESLRADNSDIRDQMQNLTRDAAVSPLSVDESNDTKSMLGDEDSDDGVTAPSETTMNEQGFDKNKLEVENEVLADLRELYKDVHEETKQESLEQEMDLQLERRVLRSELEVAQRDLKETQNTLDELVRKHSTVLNAVHDAYVSISHFKYSQSGDLFSTPSTREDCVTDDIPTSGEDSGTLALQRLQSIISAYTTSAIERTQKLEQVDALREALEETRGELTSAQQSMTILIESNANLQMLVDKSEQVRNQIEGRAHSAEVEVAELQSQIEQASGEKEETTQEMETLREVAVSKSIAEANASGRCVELELIIRRLDAEKEQAHERVEELEHQVQKMNDTGCEREQELRDKVNELLLDICTLQNDLNDMTKVKEELEQELVKCTAQVEQLLAEKFATDSDWVLQQKYKEVQDELQDLHLSYQRNVEEAAQAQNDIILKLASTSLERDEYRDELINCKVDLANALQRSDELECANRNLRARVVQS